MSRAQSNTPVSRWQLRTLHYLVLFIVWVLAVDGFVGEKGLSAMIQARRQYRALDASLAAARAENKRLLEEARRFREDSTTIEEFARREFGLIRPGETVFIIKDVTVADPR